MEAQLLQDFLSRRGGGPHKISACLLDGVSVDVSELEPLALLIQSLLVLGRSQELIHNIRQCRLHRKHNISQRVNFQGGRLLGFEGGKGPIS